VINRLATDDRSGAEDVVGTCASADFRCWFFESGNDLAKHRCSGEDLHHFGCDISAIEIGKNQNVRLAGNAATDLFC